MASLEGQQENYSNNPAGMPKKQQMHVQIKQQTVCVNDKCIKLINTASNNEFLASNKMVGRLTGHKTTAAKTTTTATTHTQKANDV